MVDRHTLHTPAPWAAVVRWAVAYVPVAAGLLLHLNDEVVALLWLGVHGPILWDLRGAHDRLAGTVVVERTASGPHGWVSSRTARQNA